MAESSPTQAKRAWTEPVYLHQLVQHHQFDRQVDCIRQRLGVCLVDPFTTEDLTDKCNGQADTDKVEIYEEFLRMACLNKVAKAEEIDCSVNIDHRDDRSLKSENDKLNALVEIVDCKPHAGIGLIATKCLDRDRHLENAEIDNDHCEHCAQYALVSDKKVQS